VLKIEKVSSQKSSGMLESWALRFIQIQKEQACFMNGSISVRLMCLLIAAALILMQTQKPAKIQAPAPQANSLTDPKELEALLDPIFAEQMRKLNIPGAVVSIVKEGKIIFTKGYGVADLEKKTPVIPDKTIFRIGSITKVFTALSVMQLSDRRKIRLTDDVNQYLTGVKVKNTFSQPITFAHLLTHTSGLDEISPGRRTSDENKVVPLEEFLKTRIVRHRPPGEIISYSTYNPALAALAVEQISRTPFKTYLQKNIFEPLGMNRTSIASVKSEYKQDLATGYEYAENKHQPLPFQWFHTYPASDINSTATDMACFMIANLQYGMIDGKRILSEKAAREMQATHFRNHPKISGWAYGFYEGTQNSLRFVEHGGSMDDGYSALMTLIPEKGVGIFVACNTENGGFGIGEAVKNAVFNRYFPAPAKPEVPQTKNPSPDALKKFAGQYRPIIYCHSCPPNSGAYVPNPFEVKITDDGMLLFLDRRFKQIEPLLFVQADGERSGQVLLGFKENKAGEIAYMFQETYLVSEKVAR
jgi:CubicO group peptidase (beta-lactamase class C family)